MITWRIIPIICGEVLAEGSEILAYRNPGVKRWVPAICWYLTNDREHLIVDTGFAMPKEPRATSSGYELRSEGTFLEMLERAGCPREQVHTIVFTHLHWDHSQNLDLFPNANLLAQREEVRYAVAPLAFEADAYLSPAFGGSPGWLNARLRFLDGETQITDGITVIPTPGHTPGHQSVIVRTLDDRVGIAGDLLPTYDNIRDPETGGFYPPACYDYGAWWKSVQLFASRCDEILPSHDPKVAIQWTPHRDRKDAEGRTP